MFSDAPLVKFCADKTFKKQFIHFFVSLFIDRVATWVYPVSLPVTAKIASSPTATLNLISENK